VSSPCWTAVRSSTVCLFCWVLICWVLILSYSSNCSIVIGACYSAPGNSVALIVRFSVCVFLDELRSDIVPQFLPCLLNSVSVSLLGPFLFLFLFLFLESCGSK
jgi:hypothetical protein